MFSFFKQSNTWKHKRVRVPTVLQLEHTECGAACLSMILAYHGYYESLEKLRIACGVTRNGSKASSLIIAAGKYKLTGKGFKLPIEKIGTKPLPMIIFWKFCHYVILEGRIGKWFYINDPAKGSVRVSNEEFEKSYTGIALTFTPDSDFKKYGKPCSVISDILPIFYQVKSTCAVILWIGILLILPGLLLPAMLRVFVDEVLSGHDEWLLPLIVGYTATMIIQSCLVYTKNIAFCRGELKLAANNTIRLFKHLLSLPIEFFIQRSSADLQCRVMANSGISRSIFEHLVNNGIKIFTSCFYLFLMYHFSPPLTLIVVSMTVLNLMFLAFTNKRNKLLNEILINVSAKMQIQSMIGISLMETLRAGGRDDDYFTEWINSLCEYSDQKQKAQFLSTFFAFFPDLILKTLNVFILCFGAWAIIRGEMTLGVLMAFQSLVGSFMAPTNELIQASASIQELKGSIDRVNDIYNYERDDIFGDNPLETCWGKIEFCNVTFGYSKLEAPLIENFSMTIESGKRIALVGFSGSGKSTISRLAAGIFAPWSGEILLDGVPLNKIRKRDFSRMVSFVDQDIILFSGTVVENLTLFQRQHTALELHGALIDAALSDELSRRGNELEIQIGERGNNFSGGQCQRLEIARAFARQTPIMIFDEATSALDPQTELIIDRSLRQRKTSCLIVAHRLSTIRDSDEIIIMSTGKVTERGKHDELMAINGEYAQFMRLESEVLHD